MLASNVSMYHTSCRHKQQYKLAGVIKCLFRSKAALGREQDKAHRGRRVFLTEKGRRVPQSDKVPLGPFEARELKDAGAGGERSC